ncbi:UNVERIFIED_CONTAM: hypothetical protein FKN15_012929 [Acipenser sinensis]
MEEANLANRAKAQEFIQATSQYLKKLNTQERAVEEVKLSIKPYYQRKEITKEEYKGILRKAVHKCVSCADSRTTRTRGRGSPRKCRGGRSNMADSGATASPPPQETWLSFLLLYRIESTPCTIIIIIIIIITSRLYLKRLKKCGCVYIY